MQCFPHLFEIGVVDVLFARRRHEYIPGMCAPPQFCILDVIQYVQFQVFNFCFSTPSRLKTLVARNTNSNLWNRYEKARPFFTTLGARINRRCAAKILEAKVGYVGST